ncbi:hypothetical protein [Marinilabilia sp.]
MKYLLSILTSLLFYNLSVSVNAQKEDLNAYEKKENFIYPGSQFRGIEVNNQHGNIHVSASTGDTIEVNIVIIVKENNEELASEILEKINIRSAHKGQSLYLRTDFGDNFQPNNPFSIEYDIRIPSSKTLDLKNRFGDINIHSITGNQNINMEYGELIQKGISTIDSINLDLSFVDAELTRINYAQLQFHNVNAEIKNIHKGDVSGKYCQINLSDADELNIKSGTSRFKIGNVRNLSLDGEFCFTSIGHLSETGDLKISNGLLIISSIASTLRELSVFNNNAPINLSLPKNLSYTLHGEVTNGQFQHYAANHFRIIKELDKTSFSGSYNSKPNEASIVLFNENAGIIIEE